MAGTNDSSMRDFTRRTSVADPSDAAVLGSMKTNEDIIDAEKLKAVSTYVGADAQDLSPEHREYLMQRHGTLELNPMPGYGDADPYNWPQWKVMPHPKYTTVIDEAECWL